MKKYFTIFSILVAIILIPSCQKELPDAIKNIDVSQGEKTPTPAPTPTAELKVSEPGQFGAKGGEQTVTVTATAAWTISKSAGSEWLTIKPESGNAGTSQVTLTVAENTTTGLRTSMISVKSGELSKSIEVSQSAANPEISLDISSMEFASGSGSKSMKITSNTSWTVSSNQTWCSVSPTSGNGDGGVTVSVDENSSTSKRTATITVESETITRMLSVTQSGVEATPVPTPSSKNRTFTVGGVQFKMIYVEGGTFTKSLLGRIETISSYYIGETEVTQALWQAVMGSNPSYFSGNNRPVENVSFGDCLNFISRLNEITGENFRLPTWSEWEYAAQGGKKSQGYTYAGSNTLDDVAWNRANCYNKGEGNPDYGTHVVATKQPNELGIYDMSGNVSEWCNEWWGMSSRMRRGGSWVNGNCSITGIDESDPDIRFIDIGFRIVL